MPLLSTRNTTIARISFFTHAPINNRIDVFGVLDSPGLVSTTALVGFEYSKTLAGAAAGNVTINMKAHKESLDLFFRQGLLWTDLLEQGDWWQIEILKNGNKLLLSVGVIDAVGYSTIADANGAPISTVVLSGRDYGFGVDDTPIFFNPYDPTIDNAAGINMTQILQDLAGSPGEIVQTIIRGFMGGRAVLGGYIEVPFGISKLATDNWASLLDDRFAFLGGKVVDNLRGGALITPLIKPENSGTVWDTVKAWCNPVLNEVFIDTTPVRDFFGAPRSVLVMREKPFVNLLQNKTSPWYNLVSWDVDMRTVTGVNLSRGHNRINYIQMTGDLQPVLQTNALGVYNPVSNAVSIKRHGLKRLEESTIYHNGEALGILAKAASLVQAPFEVAYREWLFLLLSWNLLNHRYWQGEISIGEMRGEISIGEKIFLRNAALGNLPGFPLELHARGLDPSFYVESVSHTYTEGEKPIALTKLQVSRGFVEDLRTVAMAEEALGWALINTTPASSADKLPSLGVLDAIKQIIIDPDILKLPDTEPFTSDGTVVE